MDKKVLDFLEKEHVSCLTIVLPDGTPHSASMHFASSDNTFVFFTKMTSKKCKDLEFDKKYKATVTVGFDEHRMVEFQSTGEIEKIDKKISETEEKIFASKFKGAQLDSDHIVLKYVAKWWRYTEFKPKFSVLESK